MQPLVYPFGCTSYSVLQRPTACPIAPTYLPTYLPTYTASGGTLSDASGRYRTLSDAYPQERVNGYVNGYTRYRTLSDAIGRYPTLSDAIGRYRTLLDAYPQERVNGYVIGYTSGCTLLDAMGQLDAIGRTNVSIGRCFSIGRYRTL